MGIFSGKDVYSKKFTTADIQTTDRVFFVPIRYLIGNFFLVELDKVLYCFEMDGTQIKTHRHFGIIAFRKIYYTIANYRPINAEKTKELEFILKQNHLPKISKNLFDVLTFFKNKEKTIDPNMPFTPHQINDLVTMIGEKPQENQETYENLKQFCENLEIKEIVTPIKGVEEYLDKEIKVTNPQYMGSIVNMNERVDNMRKKVTNTPVTGKNPWIKWIAILSLVGLIAGVGIWAWQSGAIDNALPHIGPPSNPGVSQDDLIKKYPDAGAAKAAIARGEVKLSDFPKTFQDLIKNAKLPTAPVQTP